MQKEYYSLKKHNTFGLDVHARYFFEYYHKDELISFLQKNTLSEPYLILGGGSNLLFTKDFEGTIIHPQNKGIEILSETLEHVQVLVAAGEVWDDFVAWSVQKNLYGIENLSLIPGSVGASAIQNIGAYGVEAKDCIVEVHTVHIPSGESRIFSHHDCKFGYRTSIFKHAAYTHYCVTHITYTLSKIPKLTLSYGNVKEEFEKESATNAQDVRRVICRIRNEKLPNPEEIGNAGSFFKNPVISEEHFAALLKKYPLLVYYKHTNNTYKIAAGWLIDNLQAKTFEVGGAAVHPKQALVLINKRNAQAQDILQLAEKIQTHIYTETGIQLEPEVIYI